MLRSLAVSTFLAAGVVSLSLVPVEGQTTNSAGSSSLLLPDLQLKTSSPLDFVETDATVNLGRSGVMNITDGDFTLLTWVYFHDLVQPSEWAPEFRGPCFGPEDNPGCDMSIVDRMASPAGEPNGDGWRLLKQSDNHFWFCLGGENQTNGCVPELPTTVRSQTAVAPGTWYHVAVRKAAGRISIYVDGALEGTTALGPFFDDNAADVLVGANNPEGALLFGNVGEVTFYKRALGALQIRGLFEISRRKYSK